MGGEGQQLNRSPGAVDLSGAHGVVYMGKDTLTLVVAILALVFAVYAAVKVEVRIGVAEARATESMLEAANTKAAAARELATEKRLNEKALDELKAEIQNLRR